MADATKNEVYSISNEDVIHELTKDLEQLNSIKPAGMSCVDGGGVSPVTNGSDRHLDHLKDESSDEDETEHIDDVVDCDIIDEEKLKDMELLMTEEEKETKKTEAMEMKDKGNELFKVGDFSEAVLTYTASLRTCPLIFSKERAIIYSNRAAAKMKLGRSKSAVEDCDKAIDLDPEYLRAIVRRATLNEELEQLDEALADWKRVLEKYPDHTDALLATKRLPPLIEEKNEKLKAEMLEKLKSLGNMILRPFGLSTENFKMAPNGEGGYSVQFQQNNS